MENYGLTFHHFGLAVKQIERATHFLRGLGYRIGEPVRDELQNVNLVMCSSETMPDVEIIWPTATPGPVSNILKYSKEMIYHACYESPQLDRTIALIRGAGNSIACVAPPQPAILFAGRKVSFYYVEGFGMIEILEAA